LKNIKKRQGKRDYDLDRLDQLSAIKDENRCHFCDEGILLVHLFLFSSSLQFRLWCIGKNINKNYFIYYKQGRIL
jgi:hypothetical protein